MKSPEVQKPAYPRTRVRDTNDLSQLGVNYNSLIKIDILNVKRIKNFKNIFR